LFTNTPEFGLKVLLYWFWYLRKMEDVKDREFRKAFGWKYWSRVPKRAARNDDGRRKDWWWKKPAKPRETGGMPDRVGNA
jgi:hypothetical protein